MHRVQGHAWSSDELYIPCEKAISSNPHSGPSSNLGNGQSSTLSFLPSICTAPSPGIMAALFKHLLSALSLYGLVNAYVNTDFIEAFNASVADLDCYKEGDNRNLPCLCVTQGPPNDKGDVSCNANVYWDHIVTSQGTGTIELFDYTCRRIGRADNTHAGMSVFSELKYTFDVLTQTASFQKNQETGNWQWPITAVFSARYGAHGVASPALGGDCWCGE